MCLPLPTLAYHKSKINILMIVFKLFKVLTQLKSSFLQEVAYNNCLKNIPTN